MYVCMYVYATFPKYKVARVLSSLGTYNYNEFCKDKSSSNTSVTGDL